MRLVKETTNGCETVHEVQADSRRNRIHRVDDQTDGVKGRRAKRNREDDATDGRLTRRSRKCGTTNS